jgi:hypothetical protein
MYGMTKYSLQLNYFPEHMKSVLPPTDCRRRPDQRCLENGEMDDAEKLKDILETKQRAVKKYMDKTKTEHVPAYFVKKYNEIDQKDYWIYNEKYWEEDRPQQNWERLPDIFSSNYQDEIVEYLPEKIKKNLKKQP